MHVPLSSKFFKTIGFAAMICCLLFGAGMAAPAVADGGAFIAQMQTGALLRSENLLTPVTHPSPVRSFTPSVTPVQPLSQSQLLASPVTGNVAVSLTVGIGNHVWQYQSGAGNYSATAVLGGRKNNVAVWQDGNDLRSQVVLMNTSGLSVGVVQPNRAAPVNVFIAGLPNGGLLIKR